MPFRDMHFMLQKEVVNRLVAGPSSKAYGRFTVMAQYYCQMIPVLEVPPTVLYASAESGFCGCASDAAREIAASGQRACAC